MLRGPHIHIPTLSYPPTHPANSSLPNTADLSWYWESSDKRTRNLEYMYRSILNHCTTVSTTSWINHM